MVFGKGTDPGWNLMVASRWMSSLTWLVDSCRAVRRSWIISNDDIVFYLRGGGIICSWARSWVAASSIRRTCRKLARIEAPVATSSRNWSNWETEGT